MLSVMWRYEFHMLSHLPSLPSANKNQCYVGELLLLGTVNASDAWVFRLGVSVFTKLLEQLKANIAVLVQANVTAKNITAGHCQTQSL